MPFALANDLKAALDERLPRLVAGCVSEFPDVGADAFLPPVLPFLQRGKRTRALAAACGWLAAGGEDALTDQLLSLGLALELYQAHALIHDDIIDHADARRGLPALHVTYAQAHRTAGWDGDAADFGTAAALLAGDYLLAAAADLAHAACHDSPAAWARWSLLTREVALGQYLDVQAEHAPHTGDDVATALAILTHKSANYSVVHPVALGALIAGGDDALVATLDAMTLPWGCAFQLRDDDLGVFGDPALTGKPSGDDLREGKRTVLIGLALQHAEADHAAWLDALLRTGSVTDADVARARAILTDSGARAEHEERIAAYAREGYRVLDGAGLPAAGEDACRWLGGILIDRDA